jgi:hypothetical protein
VPHEEKKAACHGRIETIDISPTVCCFLHCLRGVGLSGHVLTMDYSWLRRVGELTTARVCLSCSSMRLWISWVCSEKLQAHDFLQTLSASVDSSPVYESLRFECIPLCLVSLCPGGAPPASGKAAHRVLFSSRIVCNQSVHSFLSHFACTGCSLPVIAVFL